MSTLYVLQNQHGHFLKKVAADKHKEWGDGQEPQALFRTIHRDEALNMLVETNSQAIDLRITIKEYPANAKRHPVIPAEDLPAPLPKEDQEPSAQEPLELMDTPPVQEAPLSS